MLVSSLLLMAQTAAAVPGLPPQPTATSLQAAFDAATQAYEAKQWADAVRLFDALEARLGAKASKSVRATIDLRRGIALKRTGNTARAEPMLRSAVDAISPYDATLSNERFYALIELGADALQRSDFAGGLKIADRATAEARTPADRLDAAILGLQGTMFDGGDAALAYADAAQKLTAEMPKTTKRGIAQIDTLRARLLLNLGRVKEAYDLLKGANRQQGGLDTTVNLAEVETRSDLAIAALLNKDQDAAREYLAYTGAGRLSKSPFGRAALMDPPQCGDGGIAADDNAIVEFGILPTGGVSYAQTVYMSRPSRAGAKAFADAVLQWTWQADAMERIPPFFRALNRVELRCANAVVRPAFNKSFTEARDAYLTSFADRLPMIGGSAAALPLMRAELARRKALPGNALAVPLMLAIARNPATSPDESGRMVTEALALLPPDAPVRLRAAVSFDAALLTSKNGEAARIALRSLLASADFAADPVSTAILRLATARRMYKSPPPADAEQLIRDVVDDERLDKNDPLKTAALIELANVQSRTNQVEAATATFARTGLTSDQCALLDTPPSMVRSNISRDDFPLEAQRWGFEGWTKIEQDILADGRASATRVVIAYPPFVFTAASTAVASDMQYEPTFRPGSKAGCIGSQRTFSFRIAENSK